MDQRKAASGGIVSLFILALFAGITILPGAAAAVPTFTSATTMDLDADGRIDAIDVVMSIAIWDKDVRLSDFSVAGHQVIGFSTTVGADADADDEKFRLLISESAAPDTDAKPVFSYTKGTLADKATATDFVASAASITVTDGALPVLIGQTLKDTVLAGGIEGYVYLTFSEPVNFLAAKYTNNGGACAGAIVAADIDSITPTGATKVPVLAVKSDPTVAKTIFVPAADAVANCVALKAASTGITGVTMDQGSAVVRITFDTPLESASGIALAGNDIKITTDAGGAVSGFTTFVHTAGSNQATGLLNAKANAADFSGTGTTFELLANAARTPGSQIVAGTTALKAATGTLPTVVSAKTVDTDADGLANAIQVTLNQDLDPLTSSLPAEWAQTPANAVSGTPAPGAAPNSHILTATLNAEIAGGLLIDSEYNDGASLLTDAGGSAFSLKRFKVADGVAPIVSSYSTIDANADGSVEAILVTMSEAIDDSFISTSDFAVVGGTISGFNTKVPGDVGAGTDDAKFLLNLATVRVGTGYDAAFTVKLTTTTLKDLAGNVAVNDAAPVKVKDGAAPVIISAEGSQGVSEVTLTFSELVGTNAAQGALTAADLQWVSTNGGASGITSVAAGATAAKWVVTANSPLTAADLTADKIHALAGEVWEDCQTAANCISAAQKAPVTQKALSTIGAVTLTTVKTTDADADGKIDGLLVTASGNIDDTTLAASAGSWAITIGGVSHATGAVATGATANDNQFLVPFAEYATVDTAKLASFVFTTGTLKDSTGAKVASLSGSATDGALPIITQASTSTGLDKIYLTHSEPVSVASGSVAGGNFRYLDGNAGAGAISIASATHTAGSTMVTLTTNVKLAGTDFTADKVAARATLLDAAGNSASLVSVSFVDKVLPTVTKVQTEDANKDGIVDQFRVIFSEDVAAATCIPAEWVFTSTTAIATSGASAGASNECIFAITTVGTTPNTGLTFTVSYPGTSGTTVADGAGNKLAVFNNVAGTDAAKPTITKAETLDSNGNGKLDGMRLTFSEPVDDSTFSLGGWDVAGYSVTNWATETVADDNVAILKFAEKVIGDTAATPAITVASGIKDMAGVDSVLPTTLSVTDTAPAALMAFTATVGSADITVTFSEPVFTDTGNVNPPVQTDFDYENNAAGGATNIVGFAAGTGNAYTLTLNAPVTNEDIAADKIGVVANEVFDAVDLAVVTPLTVLGGTPTDTTAPGAIGSFTATGAALAVDLAWTTPSDTDLSTFEIRYSTTALTSGNFATGTLFAGPTPAAGTAQTASITGLTAGTTYYVGIRVTDNSGLHSPISFASALTTTPDTTNPGTINDLVASAPTGNSVLLTWSPVGDDGATGTVTSYEIRYSTTAISTVTQFDAATLATATFSPATLLAGTATTDQTATVTGLTSATTYFIAVRAIDDAGNKGVFDSATFTTSTPDTTAPTGTLVITSATHTAGVASTNANPSVSWTGLTDAESSITYTLVMVKDSTVVSTDTTALETFTYSDLVAGTYTLTVTGESQGGAATAATFELVIQGSTTPVTKTAADAKTLSEKTVVKVTRDGNSNTVEYSNSDAVSEGAVGGQIWVFNSPGVVIATIDAADVASGKFVHTGASALADSTYLVTYFFSGDIGKFAAGAGPEETDYAVAGPSAAESKFYEETWFIVVIIIVAVLLLLLIILIIIFAARKGNGGNETEDDYEPGAYVNDGWADDSWDEPVETEAARDFHLKCPSCATDFHVNGVKPLETTCPGCGVGGTLD